MTWLQPRRVTTRCRALPAARRTPCCGRGGSRLNGHAGCSVRLCASLRWRWRWRSWEWEPPAPRSITTGRAATMPARRSAAAIRRSAPIGVSVTAVAAPGHSPIRTPPIPLSVGSRIQVPPRVESVDSVSGVRGAGVIEPKKGSVEYSIDRNGGDYRSIELPSDPTGLACKKACEAELRCRAWTYLRPGYGSTSTTAHCYLKDKVKPPRRRPCCISGVVR